MHIKKLKFELIGINIILETILGPFIFYYRILYFVNWFIMLCVKDNPDTRW